MGRAYDTIVFHEDRCDGCGDCMRACAKAKSPTGALAHSRIKIVAGEAPDRFEMALCRQCGDPRCVMVCPSGALAKNWSDGNIDWDADRCVNCLLCTAGCAYGGIVFEEEIGHVTKCDKCGGAPECVRVCPQSALEYNTAGQIFNKYGHREDLFVPGLSACQGCNSELLIRHTLRRIGPNTVVAAPPGCIPGMGTVGYNARTGAKVPIFHPLLTNTAAMLAGLKRQYNRVGRDVTMLALAGDGGSSDVGFQSLSGSAARGDQMLFVCVDNEGYMNTGMQRSSCTPYGAWTSTTPVGRESRGKTQDAKNLPLLMVMHNCEYVATASTAFMEDFYDKLDKAIQASKRGFAYLHVYSPCTTGWRFPSQQNIEVARKAVETNFVLLWEFDPVHRLHLTHPVDDPLPIAAYLKAQGKYRHLSAEQIAHIEATVAENVAVIRRLAENGVSAQTLAASGRA